VSERLVQAIDQLINALVNLRNALSQEVVEKPPPEVIPPSWEKRAALLAALEGLPPREIARRLGVPETEVTALLSDPSKVLSLLAE